MDNLGRKQARDIVANDHGTPKITAKMSLSNMQTEKAPPVVVRPLPRMLTACARNSI
jgi:hypothetical protein